jgi:acyl carrier protein
MQGIMDNVETLKQAFVAGLAVPEGSHFENLEYRGLREWNSVAHMQLIIEIENAFGIMLPTEDVIDLSSFRKAKEILTKHGVSFPA